MASVITIAGEQLFAAKAQANEQLDIDTFIFANVPNQDPSAPINREEGIPTAHIVYQQNVQQVGRINDNVVVYSTVLDSITGPFEFNWVGLYSSVNQKLVAINHVPTVTKTATAPGAAGNTLNRNFGIEYSGIAELTGITVDAGTWQIDYTARLSGMDLLTQQLATDMNGKDWFIDDGLKVVPRTTANSFSVTPGVGYVSGLRVELKQEHILIVQSYPQFVYVDAWFSGNANSTWSPQLAFTVTNTEMDDYIDPSGTQHYMYKLAVINAADDVEDFRSNVFEKNVPIVESIDSLKRKNFKVGTKVMVKNYYSGDGFEHYREISLLPSTHSVQMNNGYFASILYSRDINVGWLGWKNDGTPNLIQENNLLDANYLFNGGTYAFDFTNVTDPWFKCFYSRYKKTVIIGNGSKMILINGTQRSATLFAISAAKLIEIRDCELYFDRATADGWEEFDEHGHAISVMSASHGGEANQDWTETLIIENVKCYDWTGDALCVWGCINANINNIYSYRSRRNGFSIAAVKDLTAGYMYSEGTDGLAPMAGLDIELDIPCDFKQKIFINTFHSKGNKLRGLLFADVIKNADITINNYLSKNEPALEAISEYSNDGSKMIINNMITEDTIGFAYKAIGIKEQVKINNMKVDFIANNNAPLFADTNDLKFNGKMTLGAVYLNMRGTPTALADFKTISTASDRMELKVVSLSVNRLTKTFENDTYKDRYLDYNLLQIREERTVGETYDFDEYMAMNFIEINGISLSKINYQNASKRFIANNSAYINVDGAKVPFYKNGMLTTIPFSSTRHFELTCIANEFFYRDL